jgi:hypothetical protein
MSGICMMPGTSKTIPCFELLIDSFMDRPHIRINCLLMRVMGKEAMEGSIAVSSVYMDNFARFQQILESIFEDR